MADQDNVKPEQIDDDIENKDSDPTRTIIAADNILPETILLLPVPNRPVFPHMLIPLILPQGPEAEILKAAHDSPNRIVGIVLRKDEDTPIEIKKEDGPESIMEHLHAFGTAARVEKYAVDDNQTVHAILTGRARFEVKRIITDKPVAARVEYFHDEWDKNDKTIKAYSISIVNTLKDLIKMNPLFNEEMKLSLNETNINEPGRLADFAASLTSADKEDLQEVLAAIDIPTRVKRVLMLLKEETEIAKLKERINQQIEEKLSKQQREFFLREQLKAIKAELGLEKDEKTAHVEAFRERLEKLEINDEARSVMEAALDKFSLLSPQSPEYSMQNNHLDWLLTLPWNTYSEENFDIKKARSILEKDHYGLDKVKERILEFLGVSKLKGSTEGTILCFVGPPGVGKTSLGQSIAKALGRKFFRFSLGGMRDEAEIKGHRRTYIGAMPGKIMQALKLVGTANPLIMLDEIDKVGSSFRGDPASALLEVLDPEQNHAFLDHYLDVKFDLSKVMFIATANVLDTIPRPLLDRMDVMNMSGYLKDEKIGIAQRHLIPRQLKAHGLTTKNIAIHKSAISIMVDSYTREAGVRRLENTIKTVLRKVAAHKAEHPRAGKVTVTRLNIDTYLGRKKYMGESLLELSRPGVVIGLAWTPVGGTILFIEGNATQTGKPGFSQTGQLGDVMIESSRIAYTHIRSIWPQYAPVGKEDFFKENTIHLHVPAGATPKDGPSAGITMGTSLLSLASGIPLNKKIGMTGELTLTGRVLPIGGLKEKLLAAKTAKLNMVLVPAENKPAYDEVPDNIRKGLKVHFVSEFREVIELVFGKKLPVKKKSKKKSGSKKKKGTNKKTKK